MSSVTVLASTQNQFASNSGGMTPPQLVVSPVNSTQITSSATLAYTILPGQSGSIITIPVLTTQAGGTVVITLPDPATNPGFNCKFVLTGAKFAGQVINIVGPANSTFHPVRVINEVTPTLSAVCRGVSFLTGVISVAGDGAQVVSDGFRYSCTVSSSLPAGVAALANL
jgi:rRNA processing protein Gar1